MYKHCPPTPRQKKKKKKINHAYFSLLKYKLITNPASLTKETLEVRGHNMYHMVHVLLWQFASIQYRLYNHLYRA